MTAARPSTTASTTAAATTAAMVAVLAVAYFVTGWAGLSVAMPPGNATALWPPSGLGLAALLVFGRRLWPGIFLGAFLTNLVMMPAVFSVGTIVGPLLIALGSTVEIVLAAFLVEHFAGGRGVIASPARVPRFVVACAIADLVAATMGLVVTDTIVGVDNGVQYWVTWWIGDVVGMLVIAPLAFVPAFRAPRRPLEWVGTIACTVVVGELVFGRPFGVGGTDLPVAWAILPAVVWAAVRLDVRAVVFHTLLIHGLASWGTVSGLGPLAPHGDVGLVVLDGLLMVAIVTGLLLAANVQVIDAAHGELEGRVADRTADLGRELEEKTRLQGALVEAQKQEALGRLAGGVAHDFNNLLTVIRAEAELLLHVDDDETKDGARTVVEATDRAAELTRQLLAVARTPLGHATPIELRPALLALRRLLRPVLPAGVELTLVCDDDACIVMDPGQLDQVLLNLGLNARDAIVATGGTGHITIRLRSHDDSSPRAPGPGPWVEIDVVDDGPGIDAGLLPRIFEPFFTTRPGEGHGLGLSMASAIVAQAGGQLRVDSAPGCGTTFQVWLPAVTATMSSEAMDAASVSAASSTSAPPPGGSGEDVDGDDGDVVDADSVSVRGLTILVAEDDPQIRQLTTSLLVKEGYRVLAAADGQEALELLQAAPGSGEGRVALLITDVVMPRRDGLSLLVEARALVPGLPCLVVSGFHDHHEALQGEHQLHKPFKVAALRDAVRSRLRETSGPTQGVH